MSAILQALKKLDRDSGQLPPISTGGRQLDPSGAILRQIRARPGRKKGWLLGCAAVLVVVGTGVLVGGRMRDGSPPAGPPVSRSDLHIQLPLAVAGSTVPLPASAAGTATSLPGGKPEPAAAESTVGGPEANAFQVAEDTRNFPPDARASIATAAGSETGARNQDTENERIVLQAIAWSPRPEKRIAVVSDRVVREGGSVNGYTIVRIAEDYVVVEADSLKKRIHFPSKSQQR